MSRPHLDSADFPTLLSGLGQDSFGTVTGTHIQEDDDVDIVGRGPSPKKWYGSVTSLAAGNTWNAKVSRQGGSGASQKAPTSIKKASTGPLPVPDATETVDVTVTNNDGPSNPVPDDPVIP
jgi:hypothetical protein